MMTTDDLCTKSTKKTRELRKQKLAVSYCILVELPKQLKGDKVPDIERTLRTKTKIVAFREPVTRLERKQSKLPLLLEAKRASKGQTTTGSSIGSNRTSASIRRAAAPLSPPAAHQRRISLDTRVAPRMTSLRHSQDEVDYTPFLSNGYHIPTRSPRCPPTPWASFLRRHFEACNPLSSPWGQHKVHSRSSTRRPHRHTARARKFSLHSASTSPQR